MSEDVHHPWQALHDAAGPTVRSRSQQLRVPSSASPARTLSAVASKPPIPGSHYQGSRCLPRLAMILSHPSNSPESSTLSHDRNGWHKEQQPRCSTRICIRLGCQEGRSESPEHGQAPQPTARRWVCTAVPQGRGGHGQARWPRGSDRWLGGAAGASAECYPRLSGLSTGSRHHWNNFQR